MSSYIIVDLGGQARLKPIEVHTEQYRVELAIGHVLGTVVLVLSFTNGCCTEAVQPRIGH